MDLAFAIAILLTSVLSLVAILHVMKGTKSSKYRNFPPGPRPLPLIGNLHILNPKKPYLTLIELSKTYGPVFSVQMGSRKAVVLAGYEAVKDALVNHAEEFGDRARIPMFQQMDKGNGQPLDNAIVMNASVANIIVAILLGHRYDYQDPTFLRLLNLINENLRLLGSPMVSLYNAFPFIGFLPGEHKTILKNVEEICSFTRTVFLESLGHLDDDHKRSFIDAFLVRQQKEKSNPDTYFHNNNLLTVVKNLFSAGMETTSTSLRWGLLLLMKYPEVQKKVQEEIERVLGSAQAQYDDRNKMPYTNAVIHEIQRFANILPISIPHETASDVTFKGYFIPKGTLIIPLLASVLQDEAHFAKPKEFYPEHFLDSEGQFVKKEAFLPFSAGRRVCAGENLARMELFLFFTSLLQKFTFRPPPGVTDVDLTPAVGFTTPPKPHMVCAVARS
ncbi:cytochrome P450 2K6-like isoform X3 [Ambystoma mexicanum]|uniref:cytochrome P450 2K6-like isoform X3 n=1 Tax=Ambystoma mexicanum TaxID=8296 RepID=UPI0037E80855